MLPKIPDSIMNDSYISNPPVTIYAPEPEKTIYDVSPYVWDKKSRPNINDYMKPWVKDASQTMYKYTGLQYKKDHNAKVTYAKNQLKAALAQYDNDIAYWNELDERYYTNQSSQMQRYEDAGFNMGYMYGAVDNGNSAVGYNQESADFDLSENHGDELGGVKLVTECVADAFSLATNLVKSGFDIRLTDAKTALATWQKATEIQRGSALSLQNQWTQILRSTDENGKYVGENFANSIAFLSEKLGYQLKEKEYARMTEFVNYCGDLYKNQSTDMVKELFGDFNEIIDGVDSNAVQILLRLLAIMAVSGANK